MIFDAVILVISAFSIGNFFETNDYYLNINRRIMFVLLISCSGVIYYIINIVQRSKDNVIAYLIFEINRIRDHRFFIEKTGMQMKNDFWNNLDIQTQKNLIMTSFRKLNEDAQYDIQNNFLEILLQKRIELGLSPSELYPAFNIKEEAVSTLVRREVKLRRILHSLI